MQRIRIGPGPALLVCALIACADAPPAVPAVTEPPPVVPNIIGIHPLRLVNDRAVPFVESGSSGVSGYRGGAIEFRTAGQATLFRRWLTRVDSVSGTRQRCTTTLLYGEARQSVDSLRLTVTHRGSSPPHVCGPFTSEPLVGEIALADQPQAQSISGTVESSAIVLRDSSQLRYARSSTDAIIGAYSLPEQGMLFCPGFIDLPYSEIGISVREANVFIRRPNAGSVCTWQDSGLVARYGDTLVYYRAGSFTGILPQTTSGWVCASGITYGDSPCYLRRP